MSKNEDIKRLNWLIDEKEREFHSHGEYPGERDIRKAVYKDILDGFENLQEAEEHIQGLTGDNVIFTARGWEIKFSLINTILEHIRSNPWYSPWRESLEKPRAIPQLSPIDDLKAKLQEYIKPRLGRCYEFAWKHIAYEDEGTLVHGLAYSYKRGRMIGHAWVVTETGFVYEPVTGLYVRKDDFYKAYRAEEINTYNPTEARKMAIVTKSFGPWSDAERREVLGMVPSVQRR